VPGVRSDRLADRLLQTDAFALGVHEERDPAHHRPHVLLLQQDGANVRAISAYESDGVGHFLLVTDDNVKAAVALEFMGAKPYEKQIVLADVDNRPGALEEIARMLADADINLEYVYGASGSTGKTRFVFSTTNDEKACSLL